MIDIPRPGDLFAAYRLRQHLAARKSAGADEAELGRIRVLINEAEDIDDARADAFMRFHGPKDFRP